MKKILIIDDDTKFRQLLVKFLTQNGFHTFDTGYPLKALPIISKEAIDLILLDIMLPEMDGFLFFNAVRQSYNIPTIFVTAKINTKDVENGMKLGAEDFLSKPFQPEILLTKINTLFMKGKGCA